MRALHFDCFSGISGDMTLGAMLDLGLDPQLFHLLLQSFGLPIQLEVEKVKRNGIQATKATIQAEDQTRHRFLPDITQILRTSSLTPSQLELALGIFHVLGEAEALSHGIPLEKVHFHEVGALDSIADIACAALAIDTLQVSRITCRSVPPGSGTVKCDHGIMPVPAPAVSHLLKGVPLAAAVVKGELVTPTGAAILKRCVHEFIDQPAMTIQQIGCGAGSRDFWEQPNILRLFLGETASSSTDRVWVMETNLDDVPAEWIGYTIIRLLESGALDVYTQPLQMKKGRPGTLLGVIAPEGVRLALEKIIFEETGTFGIRRYECLRTTLQREICTVETPYGPIKAKVGWQNGVKILSPEYEDCVRIAQMHQIPLREVYLHTLAGSIR